MPDDTLNPMANDAGWPRPELDLCERRLATSERLRTGLAAKLSEMQSEIEQLRETLRSTGANRYWESRWRDEKAENDKLRDENERLRGHIYASNRPQPEDLERLRKLLDACRGAMRVTQQVHPNATDWRGMIAAIDSAIGSKET